MEPLPFITVYNGPGRIDKMCRIEGPCQMLRVQLTHDDVQIFRDMGLIFSIPLMKNALNGLQLLEGNLFCRSCEKDCKWVWRHEGHRLVPYGFIGGGKYLSKALLVTPKLDSTHEFVRVGNTCTFTIQNDDIAHTVEYNIDAESRRLIYNGEETIVLRIQRFDIHIKIHSDDFEVCMPLAMTTSTKRRALMNP